MVHECCLSADASVITQVSEATAKDVDIAVDYAQKAFETTWGLNAPGFRRAELLNNLAALMVKHRDELCAIEALDNGGSYCAFVEVVRRSRARQNVQMGAKRRSSTVHRCHQVLRRVGR